ncbi:unnamed protein product [Ilex paraguariensis]|uniref:Uncharacterized protein n=1 Tax=Ilex paraguariensis TaxID=185542 RepID=A0ABC8UFY5_9AQUA
MKRRIRWQREGSGQSSGEAVYTHSDVTGHKPPMQRSHINSKVQGIREWYTATSLMSTKRNLSSTAPITYQPQSTMSSRSFPRPSLNNSVVLPMYTSC